MKTEIEQEIEAFNEVQRIEGTHIYAEYVYFTKCLVVAYPETEAHDCWYGCKFMASDSTRAKTRAVLRTFMDNKRSVPDALLSTLPGFVRYPEE